MVYGVDVTLKPGETYFYQLDWKVGWFRNKLFLEPVALSEGQKQVAKHNTQISLPETKAAAVRPRRTPSNATARLVENCSSGDMKYFIKKLPASTLPQTTR